VDLNIPDNIWETIASLPLDDDSTLLCGSCIMNRIEKLDIYMAFELLLISGQIKT